MYLYIPKLHVLAHVLYGTSLKDGQRQNECAVEGTDRGDGRGEGEGVGQARAWIMEEEGNLPNWDERARPSEW